MRVILWKANNARLKSFTNTFSENLYRSNGKDLFAVGQVMGSQKENQNLV
jgi:hypothetical protein